MSLRRIAMSKIRSGQDAAAGSASAAIARAARVVGARDTDPAHPLEWARRKLAHARGEFATGNYRQAMKDADEIVADLHGWDEARER